MPVYQEMFGDEMFGDVYASSKTFENLIPKILGIEKLRCLQHRHKSISPSESTPGFKKRSTNLDHPSQIFEKDRRYGYRKSAVFIAQKVNPKFGIAHGI